MTRMRVLVTGSKGMLGQDLVSCLNRRHEVIPFHRGDADITRADQVWRAMNDARPDAVIHTAAFTAVDDCERQPELAFSVNADGTCYIADACRRLKIPMLYVSTDYVFDGEKTSPYEEDDSPNPLNIYGKSKLKGEKYVLDLVDDFRIVRVSWLFGAGGRNFVRTILGVGQKRKPLQVVDDQVGSPTYTKDLAIKLGEVLERGSSGIYHITNQGFCSWFDLAKEAMRVSGLDSVPIAPTTTSQAGRPAPRPKNSRLANTQLRKQGIEFLPSWQDALSRFLSQEHPLGPNFAAGALEAQVRS
jgi:dTDP-4-dehydrorhamnose reductase